MVVICPFVTVVTLVSVGKSLIIEVLLGKNIIVDTTLIGTVAVTIIVPVAVLEYVEDDENKVKHNKITLMILYMNLFME
jgi:hypothetical protein